MEAFYDQLTVIVNTFEDSYYAAYYSRPSCFRTQYAMAYLANNNLPRISLAYDRVSCTREQANKGVDLWECDTAPPSGRCDGAYEAVMIKCVALSEEIRKSVRPGINLCECVNNVTRNVCFKNATCNACDLCFRALKLIYTSFVL